MRCFLAIELPEPVRRRLADLQDQLRHIDRLVRWTRPAQIHLTLKFFGEVPDAGIDELCRIARDTARELVPFDLHIRGVGCFPPQGPPRVIWAGIEPAPPALLDAQRAFEEAYASRGYPPEGRPYRPHLTLARTRERAAARLIRSSLESVASFSAGSVRVHELVLFQSMPGRGGTEHIPLARAGLQR